jgi:16S rRNA (cytosine967-C5)-methyltransferase
MSRSGPSRGRAVLRLRYASELWRQYVDQNPLPQLDRWLAAALRQYPQFGRKDRRAYSEILFAAARFGYLAVFFDFTRRGGAWSGSILGEREMASLLQAFAQDYAAPEAAASALRQLPAELVLRVVGRRYRHEALDEWPLAGLEAEADDALIDQLLDVLCRWQAAAGDLSARLLWQGIPLWFAAPLAARVSRSGWSVPELDAFLAAQARQPPLWLRLNHIERKDEVLRELAEHELAAVAAGQAIRVSGERSIQPLHAYRTGAIEIQDWASQQIGRAVTVQPGDLVWDACAGGGGKSVQLAAALAGTGALYASDIRQHKLAEVLRRASRAGFDNVHTSVWSGDGLPLFASDVVRQGFDWVLVDAPCTSSGTWRRSPDARFRVTAAGVRELQALQLRLLTNAAAGVRSAGRMVYSTCSWLVDENETVVERFLASSPGFVLEDSSLHGCPAEDSDTMFSAVIRRDA